MHVERTKEFWAVEATIPDGSPTNSWEQRRFRHDKWATLRYDALILVRVDEEFVEWVEAPWGIAQTERDALALAAEIRQADRRFRFRVVRFLPWWIATKFFTIERCQSASPA